MNEPKFQCIGRPLPRVDALDKVLGRAVYAGDISFPHMLYGKILRAGVPHAVIEEIDISAAEAMEGVACVLTARDIPGINRYGIAFPDQKVLAEDKVISIADPVAAVAAESPELARDAVKAIRVKYRALPVVTNPHEALAEGAPALHPEGNLFQYVKIRKGDVAEGFQQADIILEDTFQTQVQDHTYLETESGIARMDKQGNLILQTVSQGPFRDRAQVAAVCGLPQNRVRVIRATVGGAFGGKDDVSVQVHVALL
ncbi:MAG TPA: xanthine dehydrogenase family protein molybdopterin-binding subunit, partial [Proteobacteria bacterium]|nr:xanthine dehydrogenase family protein molybdopterin-binding subunit [Pseudomonadota bacterium]